MNSPSKDTSQNTLRHKGFIGSVHFSASDEVFFGKILGVNDLVTFEGNTVVSLKKSFHEAVEDYLELCKASKKHPTKSYKGSFNIRVTPTLHQQAAQLAAQRGVSLNQLVQEALITHIEKER